jgi:hypothetical protein
MRAFEGPKTLILVAGTLPSEGPGEIGSLAAAAALARVTLFVFTVDTKPPSDASLASHPIDFQDTTLFKDSGLYSLAVQSRGAVFRASGTEDAAFDRMAREMSGYYLLGFEPTAAERDGKIHEIGVRVARKDLTVRSRRWLLIPSRATVRADAQVLGAMLANPMPETAIALRVTTYNVPDRQSARVKVVVAVESGDGNEPRDDLARRAGRREQAPSFVPRNCGQFCCPDTPANASETMPKVSTHR